MPSANPVTDALGYAPVSTSNTSSATTGNGLGKDSFMKLLVAQMRMQNPMEPTDDKEMIAQMTQFSMLEQITNMATANAEIVSSSKMSQAVSLLGRNVTYLGADGAVATGTVDEVKMVSGKPSLTVGGKEGISTSQLTEVR